MKNKNKKKLLTLNKYNTNKQNKKPSYKFLTEIESKINKFNDCKN